MKKINFFKLVSLLVVVVFVAACNDNYPESHSVDTLIALDKKDVTLHAGESVNLSAKINFQKDGKNVVTTIEKKVNWESSNSDVATIDANGKVTAVKGGTAIITAECQGTKETCAISVKDIFVAGSLELSDSEKLAVIWQKCDTGAFIKYKVSDAEFAAMVVNEQGIYYAGTEGNVAKVWKDGAEQYELGENNKITSMCIDGGDVYVIGYNTISEDNIVARLWKNGEEIGLDLTGNVSYAYDVAIEKGVVYVVGSQFREETGAGKMHDAMLWTDTIETAGKTSMSLPFPDRLTTNKHAQARTICINNGVVYVGGSAGYDSEGKPYIWKNGEEDVVVEKFNLANEKEKTFVKNLKFVNNELYAFYDTKLLMGNKKSEDAKDYMIQAQGSGYADVAVSEGSVFVVGQGYPQYANGKTNECDSSYDGTAFATILLKDNGLVDFLPRSMRAKGGEEKTKYPKSNAVAIGIR